MIVSTNSFVVTLAIAAMAIPTASASTSPFSSPSAACLACESDFDSANYLAAIRIIGGPIPLPPLNLEESSSDDEQTENRLEQHPYYRDDDAVSNATNFHHSPLPRDVDRIRYYATWSCDGGSCSSKSTSAFDAWEQSHATLEECCDVTFSWDYDNCIGGSRR
ncbi:hypothetical protein ACHAXS_004260 [Conticribra weissflogii]